MADYYSSTPRRDEKWGTGRPPNSLDRRDMGLLWGGLAFASGSAVRMKYRDVHYLAVVAYGWIFDDGLIYTPNEWASNVANHTSRDASRDLEFSKPGSAHWESAEEMRARNRAQIAAAAKRGQLLL